MANDTAKVDDKIAKDDAEFREIVTQRYMYNAEKCQDFPLIGHLLNQVPMPPIKGRSWNAFVVRTTRPTAAVDRAGELVEIPVGSEVLIPATYELAQFLSKAAASETAVYEVRIAPDKKIEIGGGQSMWTYKLAAKPRGTSRSSFGLAAVLGAVAALPAAGEARDSDMVFP